MLKPSILKSEESTRRTPPPLAGGHFRLFIQENSEFQKNLRNLSQLKYNLQCFFENTSHVRQIN